MLKIIIEGKPDYLNKEDLQQMHKAYKGSIPKALIEYLEECLEMKISKCSIEVED